MTTETTYPVWQPGIMGPNITPAFPLGATQQTLMWLIGRILAAGRTPSALIDAAEVTISITDDAIYHMMRKT